jgi:hypothetical protein
VGDACGTKGPGGRGLWHKGARGEMSVAQRGQGGDECGTKGPVGDTCGTKGPVGDACGTKGPVGDACGTKGPVGDASGDRQAVLVSLVSLVPSSEAWPASSIVLQHPRPIRLGLYTFVGTDVKP